MRKFYPLFVIIFLAQFSFSQIYYPLIRPNTSWDVMHPGVSICNLVGGDRYFFDGDTTISGYDYKIVKSYQIININPGPYCPPFGVDTTLTFIKAFMREDTLAKKVFIYYQGDELFYDFTLSAGDTLQSYYAGGGIKLIVDSVGTVMLLNGVIRNVFYLNTGVSYIESIGGSDGLWLPMVGIESPRCVIENNIPIWDWSIVPSQCFPIVGIDENKINNEIKIFPNPVSNNFNLSFLQQKEEGTLKIFDVLGNLILEEIIPPFSENKNIDISKFNSGVYFCKITWGDKSANVKIMKE